MANVQQIVRDYTLRATSTGVDQVIAKTQQLGAATDSLAVKTETSSKSQISAAAALERVQRQLDLNYRSNQAFERQMKTLDTARTQGLVNQSQYSQLATLANAKLNQTLAEANNTATVWESRAFFKTLAREAALVGGPLGGVIQQFGTLSVGTSKLSFALVGGTIGFAAIAAAAYKTVAAYVELEKHQATVANALNLTGGASGQTQASLGSLTTKLAFPGTQTIDEIRAAQVEMLKYRAVSGETFKTALQLSQDLANTGFADLKSATTAFGKALSDPKKGLDDLISAGIHFSPIQQKMIADYTKTGQVAQAQNSILKIASDQLKGATANSADTASAAYGRFSNAITLGIEQIGKNISEGIRLKDILNGIADAAVKGMQKTDQERAAFVAAIEAAQKGEIPGEKGDRQEISPAGQVARRFPATMVQDNAAAVAAWELISKITLALQKEAKEAGLTAVALRTLHEQHAAGVEPATAAGRAIAGLVNSIMSIAATKQITDQLKEQTGALRIETATIGMTIDKATEYRAVQEALLREKIRGVNLGPQQIEQIKAEAAAYGEARQAGELAVALDQAQFDAKTALLSPLEKEIALLQKRNGINPLTDEIAGMKRMTDTIKQAQEAAIGFGQDFAHQMMAGKSFTEALSSSLKNLSAKLTDKAITQLLSGEWEKAAISAISAVATALASMFTSGSDYKQFVDSIDRFNQLTTRVIAATTDSSTLNGQLAAFDHDANLQRIDEARKGGLLMGALENTLAVERLKIIGDFNKQAEDQAKQAADAQLAAAKAVADRQLSFQDRVFAAANDNSTLEGQLAAFDRAAQQERVAEVQSGGQALVDLEAAQAAERLNIIKTNNDKIVAADQAAAKAQLDALNGTAKNVVDYIAGLQSGPNASVSPTANLANSQSLYNANLALAQGGNIDAQNKFASLADNLEKAARAVYASGQGYQDIRAQIIAQGLALPAVQTTTDPVVAALRDTIAAIQVAASTQATDATLQGVIKSAIDAGNAAAIAALLVPKFDTLNTTAGTGLDFSEFVTGLGQANLVTNPSLSASDIATRDKLQSIFNELDVNGDGTISRLEAVKTATQGVSTNTGSTATNTGNTASATQSSTHELLFQSTQNGAIQGLTAGIDNSASRIVSAINGLGVVTAQIGTNQATLLANIQYATQKSAGLLGGVGGGSWGWLGFESGGYTGNVGRSTVTGVVHGQEYVSDAATVSRLGVGFFDRLSQGFTPAIPVSSPSFAGRAGNDNSEMVGRLISRIDQLEARLSAVIAGSGARGAQATVEAGEKTVEALDRSAEKRVAQERQSNRQRKVA